MASRTRAAYVRDRGELAEAPLVLHECRKARNPNLFNFATVTNSFVSRATLCAVLELQRVQRRGWPDKSMLRGQPTPPERGTHHPSTLLFPLTPIRHDPSFPRSGPGYMGGIIRSYTGSDDETDDEVAGSRVGAGSVVSPQLSPSYSALLFAPSSITLLWRRVPTYRGSYII